MTRVVLSHEVLIRAPLQTIFDYVSDLRRHPEWSSGELRIEPLSPGPVTVGKEYVSRGEFALQRDRTNTVRITHHEPPHRFSFVAHDPGVGNVVHEFHFGEQEGGVRVQRVMTLSLHPVTAFLFRFIVYPLIGGPSMERTLTRLKSKLEPGGINEGKEPG